MRDDLAVPLDSQTPLAATVSVTRAPLLTIPFLLCAAANFLQSLSLHLYLHLPGFLQTLGAGVVQIGILFGLTAAVAIAARPIIGRQIDVHGRRPSILIGGALNVMVCGLYLTIASMGPWVYAVRFAHGIAQAILFTAFFTLAADLVPPERRTEGLALFGVSGLLSIGLAGLIGDAILSRADYSALFLCTLSLATLSFLISLPLRDQPLPMKGGPRRGFFAAVKQPNLIPIWFVGTAFTTALASYFVFLKTFVIDTGYGSVGQFFAAYVASAIILRVSFAWLPDRVGAKRILLPALCTLPLGLLLLATASDSIEVLIAGALCGLGHAFVFPILSSFVVTRARASERGAALSVFTAIIDAGLLLGGPTLGFVVYLAGYPAMFATAAAILVAATLAFAVWDRGR